MTQPVAARSGVVTGGASGIGRATAETLAANGWHVVSLDLAARSDAEDGAHPDAAHSGAPADETRGATIVELTGDVSVRADLRRAGDAAERLGRLDVWVNCAGYDVVGSIDAIDEPTFDRGRDVVLGGTFWGTAEAVRRMLPGRTGSIVNVASIQALVGFPGYAAYAAFKAAIIGLSRQVAAEYAADGLRCNVVAPGFVDTPPEQRALETAADPARLLAARSAISPAGRWCSAADVAAAILFLASPAASRFVTGHVLVVDGGGTVLARGDP